MKHKIIYSILVALLIIVAGYAFIAQRKSNDANSRAGGEGDVKTATEYYEIPELGIRIPGKSQYADLTYEVQDLPNEGPGSKIVSFRTTKLKEKADQVGDELGSRDCGSQDLGTAVRLASYPNEPGPGLSGSPKDFSSFIITFAAPQGACSSSDEVWAVANTYLEALEAGFKLVETIDGKKGQDLGIGNIEGSFSYPSEVIPPQMVACAESLTTKKIHCQSGFQDKEFTYGFGYAIPLPAGSYYVYASTAADPRDPKEYRAYYNEFVKCGAKVECKDHTPITVEVVANQTVLSVDPGDWYNQK